MARIPYPDPDDLSPQTRELVENLPDLKILSMLAHADDSYSQYLLFVGSLLSRTDLDPHLRELVILRVAAKEEAEYQWVQHEGISKEIGIDEEQIEAVPLTPASDAGVTSTSTSDVSDAQPPMAPTT